MLSQITFRRGPTRLNPSGFLSSAIQAFSPLDLSSQLWLSADEGLYTGGSRQFDRVVKASLTIADNASLSTGDVDFTVSCWIYLDSLGVTRVFVGKGSATNYEFYLGTTSGNVVYFSIFNPAGAALATATASTFGALSTNTWYFLVGTHDSVANTVTVSVNGVSNSASTAGDAPTNGAGIFYLSQDGDGSQQINGRISKVGFWKRTHTSLETTYLFNLGRGRLAGELGIVGTDGAALADVAGGSLPSYWNCNETSGPANAIDAIGTNDLIPTFGELISNGGFETGGGGGADVYANWTEVAAGTGTVTDELVIVDAGAHAAKLTGSDDSANYSQLKQVSILTVGRTYNWSVRARHAVSGTGKIFLGGNHGTGTMTLTGSYATYSGSRTVTNNGDVILEVSSGGTIAYFDTVSVKAVDIPAAPGPESEIASDAIGTNNGVLTNFAAPSTSWSSDRPAPIAALVNGCLEFDGTNDYVKAVGGASGTSSDETHSVSFWMKATVNSVDVLWLAAATNLTATTGTGKLFWQCGATTREYDNTTIADGTWHHVVTVKTAAGDNGIAYLDGVAQTPTSGTLGNTPVADASFWMGLYNDAVSNPYGGNLSDVRVYNVSLSAGQVAELFAGSEATGATPTARWKLDDGPQTGLVDGDPIIRKSSSEGSHIDFEQAEPEKRLTRSTTAIPGMIANGVNQGLVHVGTISTSTDGTFSIAFKTGASAFVGDQVLLATADEAVANKLLKIARNSAGKCFIEVNDSGTVHRVTGDTVLSNSTGYILTITSSGTAWAMWVNGVLQTLTVVGANSGKWFGDLAGRDNVTIAMLKTTSESEWFEGTIGGGVLVDSELTATQRGQVEEYLADEAGISL